MSMSTYFDQFLKEVLCKDKKLNLKLRNVDMLHFLDKDYSILKVTPNDEKPSFMYKMVNNEKYDYRETQVGMTNYFAKSYAQNCDG